jgi:DNA replication protein DnaC
MEISQTIEICVHCGRSLTANWIPPVKVVGKPLAGTGTWQSPLTDGVCDTCIESERNAEERMRQGLRLRNRIRSVLGSRPAYEFTFDRFAVSPENRSAYETAIAFDPRLRNLYLWGACGVGKTHLAYAIARRALEVGQAAVVTTPPRISRRLRMREPDEEQSILDRLIRADVLVIDELGIGHETAFLKQILQEILDGRTFDNRSGLVITSKFSLDALAAHLKEDAIPSRLAGRCVTVEMGGLDHRLRTQALADLPLAFPTSETFNSRVHL